MLSADGIAPWDPMVLGLARQTPGAKSRLLPVRSVVNENAAYRSAQAIERTPVATSDIVRLIARVLTSLTVALSILSVWQLQFVGSGDLRAGRNRWRRVKRAAALPDGLAGAASRGARSAPGGTRTCDPRLRRPVVRSVIPRRLYFSPRIGQDSNRFRETSSNEFRPTPSPLTRGL